MSLIHFRGYDFTNMSIKSKTHNLSNRQKRNTLTLLKGDRKSVMQEDISHPIASLDLLKLQEKIAFPVLYELL